MKLKLCSISDEYCNYLRRFDDKIYDNKETIRTHTRKYVGVVMSINNMNYYIPMSSPKSTDYLDKEKTIIKKSTNTIIRMIVKNREGKEELRGTLIISNMVPVPIEEIILYNSDEELDNKYKDIIKDEISFLRKKKNEKSIILKANLVYKQKKLNLDIEYLKNCVDYSLLEEKCKEYIENYDK